jgi:hypothetical protein
MESYYQKIDESNANIVSLQETKRETIDMQFIRNFAPKQFDCFDFCPSVGASSGILVCWASNCFTAVIIDKQSCSHPKLAGLI